MLIQYKKNQVNARRTSVDRSTRATLVTYNTRIYIGRMQKIYQLHPIKLNLHKEISFTGNVHSSWDNSNTCHVEMELMENTAYSAWIPT